MEGIEPTFTGPEPGVLPLDDTPIVPIVLLVSRSSLSPSLGFHFVGGMGIEPTSLGLRVRCATLVPTSQVVVGRTGIEPASRRLKVSRTALVLTSLVLSAGLGRLALAFEFHRMGSHRIVLGEGVLVTRSRNRTPQAKATWFTATPGLPDQ